MKNVENIVKFFSLIFLGLLFANCICSHTENNKVDLAPNDSRPVYSITIADGNELALLKQQLKIEPVYARGKTLYFLKDEVLIEKLEALGYRPVKENPYDVYERIVRVKRRGKEEELMKTGVRLINRENSYWIVRGNLEQLKILQRLGYRINRISQEEPRPREVRILVKQKEDVAWVAAIHVDIYTVIREDRGFAIYAGALDYQIDKLREREYEVEIINTVKQGGEK